jgi:multicomponent Na+:H+ antiporter subunit E
MVAAGIGCAAALLALGIRMRLIEVEGHPNHHPIWPLFWYWPWLLKEIVKTAWQVSVAILHPKLPITPRVVRFKPSQKTEVGLVILANSITLTPGSMTIEARPDEFVVHALTEESAASVGAGSDMDRRVALMEGTA